MLCRWIRRAPSSSGGWTKQNCPCGSRPRQPAANGCWRLRGMGKTLVMKFGGTSVGQAAAIRQVAGIVRREHASGEWARLVVVVSAMSQVTDKLLAGAQAAVGGERQVAEQLAAEIR